MLEKYKSGFVVLDKQQEKIFNILENIVENTYTEIQIKTILSDLVNVIEKYDQDETDILSLDVNRYSHNLFLEMIKYYWEYPQKIDKKKAYTILQTWKKKHIQVLDKIIVSENTN